MKTADIRKFFEISILVILSTTEISLTLLWTILRGIVKIILLLLWFLFMILVVIPLAVIMILQFSFKKKILEEELPGDFDEAKVAKVTEIEEAPEEEGKDADAT